MEIVRLRASSADPRSDYTGVAMATVTLPTEIQPRSPQGRFQNEPLSISRTPENVAKCRRHWSWWPPNWAANMT